MPQLPNILPIILVRNAGMPIKMLSFLEIPSSLLEVKRLKIELDQERARISDELLAEQKTIKNQKDRMRVFNFRRDFFRGHISTPPIEIPIGDRLSSEIQIFLRRSEAFESYVRQQEEAFNVVCSELQQKFEDCINQESFRNGVLHSSIDLFEATYFGKEKKEKTMNSLSKYLSRAITKTSPFSTFSTVEIQELAGYQPQEGKCYLEKSIIQLNNRVFLYIKEFLMLNQKFRNQLVITLNSTLKFEVDSVSWLINSGNVEVLKKARKTETLTYILKFIEAHEGVTTGAVYSATKSEINTEAEVYLTYLLKLFDSGVVEFHFPVSGLDTNWLAQLIDFLSSEGLVQIDVATHTLKSLRGISNTIENIDRSSVFSKYEAINSIFLEFRKLILNLVFLSNSSEKHKKEIEEEFLKNPNNIWMVRRENLFFENVYRKNNPSAKEVDLTNFAKVLDQLTTGITSLELNINRTHLRIKECFLEDHKHGEKVSLIPFFEKFLKKEALAKKETISSSKFQNRYNYPRVIDPEHFGLQVNNHIEFQNLEPDVVAVNIKIPQYSNDGKSKSAFVQFFYESTCKGRNLKGAINGISEGYGKMFSRFLEIAEPELVEKIRQFNKDVLPDKIFVSLTDNSFMNFNCHPLITDLELYFPGSQNRVDPSKRISIEKVTVTLEKNELVFYSEDKKIKFLDLDFQSFHQRSKLFQFLVHASEPVNIGLQPFLGIVNHLISGESLKEGFNKVFLLPRLIYNDAIVLQRKTWLVKKQSLPTNKKNKFLNFQNLSDWCEENKIPYRFFVTAKVDRSDSNVKDNYKPLFIDTKNVFFVELFFSYMKIADDIFVIEEFLPDLGMDTWNREFASEVVIQWK